MNQVGKYINTMLDRPISFEANRVSSIELTSP